METGTDRRLTPDTVVIGTGNVATDIARFLAGCRRLRAIAARSINKADAIARIHGVPAYELYKDQLPEAKFYICAVTDPAIPVIAASVPDNGAIWLHTAGSVDIDIWKGHRRHYGILYPLQTISARRPVSPDTVPWLTEADSDSTLALIDDLAKSMGGYCIEHKTSHERAMLHIAAVFACNFTNYILGEAFEFLDQKGIDPAILRPLVMHTVDNAFSGRSPHELQTGPAVRGNRAVIETHISRLPAEAAETYRFLSEKIYRRHHPQQQ